jgi:NAD(P)-dependent dehydrogenase (short-subunit alcohol dehydrogenase family)
LDVTMTTTAPAYLITGPTSGFGYATALELAKHGTLILVGRDRSKLDTLKAELERGGHRAVAVVCNLSDLESVKKASAEIIALKLPIVGLLNNAGIREEIPTRSPQGWDNSFATNHLGPFALTEALLPSLPDGARVVFVVSAVEDPERKPAKMAGFRGARWLSAEASARGEWAPGGSTKPGFDSYATTKQAGLATALELARENPRLRIDAVEPGFNPGTGLGRDANVVLRLTAAALAPLLPYLMKGATTSKRAAHVITRILTTESSETGVYFDEKGVPMQASEQIRDPRFTRRVVEETRAFLRKADEVGSLGF